MTNMKFVGLFFAIAMTIQLSCVSRCEGQAGMKIKVNNRGLGFVTDVVKRLARSYVTSNSNLGSYSGRYSIASYNFNNIRVTRFSFGSIGITTSSPNVITLRIRSASFAMRGNWHINYRVWFVSVNNDGSFTADATGVDLTLSMRVGRDRNGRPTISSTSSCSADIGNMNTRVSGSSLSFLYNILLRFNSNSVRNTFAARICPTVKSAIQSRANSILRNLNVNYALTTTTSIDLALSRPPTTASNQITVFSRGRCFPTNNPSMTIPVTAENLPEFQMTSSHMIRMIVGDYVINTFLYVQWVLGSWDFWFDPDALAGFPPTGFENVLGNRPLRFFVHPSESPVARTTSENVNITAKFDLVTFVVAENGRLNDVLNISIAASLTGNVTVENGNLRSQIGSITTKSTVSSSKIGFPIPVVLVNQIVNEIAQRLLPRLNAVSMTQKTISLPVGFAASNVVVNTVEHGLEIATDMTHAG
uniref:Lipopolysaccharide-binding protein-like n=1 Tax=Ciona intestinalis TaxID=7719 RepID=F6XA49_CIOIN|nr:lipopolysaccharide-binding protein-like [Ciona intestinalis]|eukprot:XP_002127342.1 lipopolysaccharide-binding protein-like [Ciona intestinalis]